MNRRGRAITAADPGEGPGGGGLPLIYRSKKICQSRDQTEAQRVGKNVGSGSGTELIMTNIYFLAYTGSIAT